MHYSWTFLVPICGQVGFAHAYVYLDDPTEEPTATIALRFQTKAGVTRWPARAAARTAVYVVEVRT